MRFNTRPARPVLRYKGASPLIIPRVRRVRPLLSPRRNGGKLTEKEAAR